MLPQHAHTCGRRLLGAREAGRQEEREEDDHLRGSHDGEPADDGYDGCLASERLDKRIRGGGSSSDGNLMVGTPSDRYREYPLLQVLFA